MMKKNALLLISAGMITFFPFLTGCLTLEKKYPEKHYFLLNVPRKDANALPNSKSTLIVRSFRIAPQYESKNFVYQLGDLSYESDFYNEFFIKPGLLITEEIEQRMAESGLFQYVLNTTSYTEPGYVLEGAITALYGDYRKDLSARAVMEIQFFFIHKTLTDAEIALQKNYHKEIPLPERVPDALVQGWNSALQQILAEFETDIKVYFDKENN